MRLNLCAAFDRKTRTYDPMFQCRSLAEVERDFSGLKKNPETKFGKHPEDYEAHHLGYFNDEDITGNEFFTQPVILNC